MRDAFAAFPGQDVEAFAATQQIRPSHMARRQKAGKKIREGGTILLPGSSPAAGIRFCCTVRSEPRSICLTLGREAYRLGSQSECFEIGRASCGERVCT